MKTELKRELFHSAWDLCNFVNERNITKENIQAIIEDSDVYDLFYWEVTVWQEIKQMTKDEMKDKISMLLKASSIATGYWFNRENTNTAGKTLIIL